MKTRHIVIALGLAVSVGGALAQTTWKSTCTSSGSGTPETVGEGLTFSISTSICTVVGGPLDGSVMTANSMWENVKGASTLLSGDGVFRKPGGAAAYRNNTGTMKMLMQDGKPVGWEGSGTSVFALATGSAAALKGKTSSWTAKSTGYRTYIIESKLD